ncbi:MAG: c-type cytochrome biogenesis protein CcmI [Dinoroseobacter sp.]|nr:c-type cytochrome biogenesis protein CcmI [Dinoroseobacter sp.]
MIWLVFATIAFVAAGWIALPFLRGRVMEDSGGDATISIYADQIDEVDRDLRDGLISEEEARAAVTEIEKRRTTFARNLPSGFSVSHRAVGAGAISIIVVVAAALGGYAKFGAPDVADLPLEARNQELLERRAEAGDMTSKIKLLIQKTEAEPEDFENWWTLARSYAAIGDNANSAEAYRRAVLLDDSPGVQSAYAEAMTLANGNKVPDGAELIFSQVAREVNDPRALYYLALARAQRQDFEGAIADWSALAQASDPNAPWMALVRRDITNMARFLKVEVADYLPDASPAEIAAAEGTQHGPQDLDAIRAKLTADPMDHAAWIALARGEVAAGNPDAAAAAMAEARVHFRAAPFVLNKFDETERALGLDLVAAPPAPRGPTKDDVAAASQLSEAERADMIEGMVAGLAARLEEHPNDPDGWVMLIRSYRTLGKEEKAAEALKRVNELYADQSDLRAEIMSSL